MYRRVSAGLLSTALVLLTILPVVAGTTGGLRGRIIDRATGRGVPAVRVTLSAPSESAAATTDANGNFVLLSLAPDTYTVSVEPAGYDATAQSGINVVADQVQTISLTIVKTIATIGRTVSRASAGIVRPGTTSDVYSVNSAGQQAAAALGGPGGLNQAYSAFASVPGVNLQQGQQGWNQLVYVRGGDYEDVATELDGIPVQRASDVAPITTLSSLGQQELQIYTGGAPASADASGLSGYVNQVIRTGTYPGFKDFQVGFGAPAFYHKLQAEIGGATSNRNFSYYIGVAGINQDYRYGDQSNAAGNPAFFAPLSVPSNNNGSVYDGSGPFVAAPGQSYSIANTNDREFVANLHFGLPHRSGSGKDDVQLLYANARILAQFYGSVNDLGGIPYVSNAVGATPSYVDSSVYNGPLMTPLTGSEPVTPYFFPGSSGHAFGAPLPADLREISDNGFSLIKLQYQKNINDRSYLQLFGYSDYSNWFINGPVSANLDYGGEIADYEVIDHTYGLNARYENQLTSKHLMTATASYQTQNIQTYSNGSNGGEITTNLIDSSGDCFSPLSGGVASCYKPIYNSDGSINGAGGLNIYGQYGAPVAGFPGSALIDAARFGTSRHHAGRIAGGTCQRRQRRKLGRYQQRLQRGTRHRAAVLLGVLPQRSIPPDRQARAQRGNSLRELSLSAGEHVGSGTRLLVQRLESRELLCARTGGTGDEPRALPQARELVACRGAVSGILAARRHHVHRRPRHGLARRLRPLRAAAGHVVPAVQRRPARLAELHLDLLAVRLQYAVPSDAAVVLEQL
jgi:Carboxypeptidase regulatory-like domain/TonB-dependent Receptor Plug Domain